MTKEYPSTKSEKTDIFPGNQAEPLVIRSSGFIRVWVFRNSSFVLVSSYGGVLSSLG